MLTLQKLKARKVRTIISTRDPYEHDESYHRDDAHRAIASLQCVGAQVLYTGAHHRKLVILDRSFVRRKSQCAIAKQ